MNSKVFMVLRILLGLFVLVFGLDKFLHFVPIDHSGMSESALGYMQGLADAKTTYLVGLVEVLAGLSFLLNKYGALMALILMSISINAVLFHATLDPATIPGALILLVLNITVLIGYKDKYKALLS